MSRRLEDVEAALLRLDQALRAYPATPGTAADLTAMRADVATMKTQLHRIRHSYDHAGEVMHGSKLEFALEQAERRFWRQAIAGLGTADPAALSHYAGIAIPAVGRRLRRLGLTPTPTHEEDPHAPSLQ